MILEFALPKKSVTNIDLKKSLKSFDANKFETKIGIKNRYVSDNKETSSKLAIDACLKLSQKFDFNKIDLLIVCTQTPDHILPGNASIIQDKVGLGNIPSFDINLGCSGFIYCLYLAKSFFVSGMHKNILIVNTDTYTKYLHPDDKANRGIFGDAASACIISEDIIDHNFFGEFILGTDGSGYRNLIIRNGGGFNSFKNNPAIKTYGDDNRYDDNCIYMNGPEIFNFTIDKIPSLVKLTLEANSLKLDDIDYFIFHQANAFMLNYLMRKIKIPQEKFIINMSETGNTVSCTIPIAYKKSIMSERIKAGSRIMLVGFGVGLSWGATIIKT